MDFKLKNSSLNLSVRTAPELPGTGKENDIIVISEVPMVNWILSPDSPSVAPRNDGDVWLTYSVDGNTFNALKQNAMMITMISAKQYIDGAWVDKEAKSYQNGEWVGWAMFPYNGGNTGWQSCTSDAGGWHTDSMTFSDGAICLKNTNSANIAGAATTEKYNLSAFKSIEFVIDSRSTGFNTGTAYVCVTSANSFAWNPGSNATDLPPEVVSSKQFSSGGTVTLDVSSLSGEYYLAILIARTKTVYCTKVSITA